LPRSRASVAASPGDPNDVTSKQSLEKSEVLVRSLRARNPHRELLFRIEENILEIKQLPGHSPANETGGLAEQLHRSSLKLRRHSGGVRSCDASVFPGLRKLCRGPGMEASSRGHAWTQRPLWNSCADSSALVNEKLITDHFADDSQEIHAQNLFCVAF
jgi:hypothetical protein